MIISRVILFIADCYNRNHCTSIMATPLDKDDDIFSHETSAPPPTIVVTSEDTVDHDGFIAKLKRRGKFVSFKRLFSHSSHHHNDKHCESPSSPLEPLGNRKLFLVRRRSMESLDELFLDPCKYNSLYFITDAIIDTVLIYIRHIHPLHNSLLCRKCY